MRWIMVCLQGTSTSAYLLDTCEWM